MPDTPPDPESISADAAAEVDTGEPEKPATIKPPLVKPTPRPVQAASADGEPTDKAAPAIDDGHEEDGERWSVRIGEVFDFGESGRFTVRQRLGRGGMGEVYKADYVIPSAPKFVQEMAIKVLRPDARPYEARTFIDEVHLLSLLRHDGIARYHTYFLDHGRQVLVMEYVQGRSLHSVLELAHRKGRTLSESTTLELVAQLAEALAHVHQAKDRDGQPLNIVHRDVSPTNILVTTAGYAKLVDFGVAKADLDGRTKTGTGATRIKGKLPYLSPEQALHRPLDGRSDLFSLCSVLVEMLTGSPPFGTLLYRGTVDSTANVTTGYVDEVTRGLSSKVRAICRKGLANNPDQRFATGREMARALLAGHHYQGPSAVQEEIEALEKLPDDPWANPHVSRVVAWVRRRRRARALVGALAFASMALILWNVVRSPAGWTPRAQPLPPAFSSAPEQPPPPMSPTAEQGMLTVNDETTPRTSGPPVATATPGRTPTCVLPARAAPQSTSAKVLPATGCAKALLAAGVLAASACVPVLHTGSKAGDCMRTPVRSVKGLEYPRTMVVELDPSNPHGLCRGHQDRYGQRYEPCPAYEGPIVVKSARIRVGRGFEDTILYGHARIIPGEETLRLDPIGEVDGVKQYAGGRTVGRMVALFTEAHSHGMTYPVCGVLLMDDIWGGEGIPVYPPDKFGPNVSTSWGGAWVKFYFVD